MTGESQTPLALVVEDLQGGYDVCDSRNGEALTWCATLGVAAGVAATLNATYPRGSMAPARDTLMHEIAMWRHLAERGQGSSPSRALWDDVAP
jgi:hypothetical protein